MTDILSKISRYSFHILRCTKLLPSSPDVTFSTNWNKKTASQIPKEISWAWWITVTECQAADFLTGVHELTTSLVSLVPISLPGSVSSYSLACFRFSHLLSLTFFLLSNLQLIFKNYFPPLLLFHTTLFPFSMQIYWECGQNSGHIVVRLNWACKQRDILF